MDHKQTIPFLCLLYGMHKQNTYVPSTYFSYLGFNHLMITLAKERNGGKCDHLGTTWCYSREYLSVDVSHSNEFIRLGTFDYPKYHFWLSNCYWRVTQNIWINRWLSTSICSASLHRGALCQMRFFWLAFNVVLQMKFVCWNMISARQLPGRW